MRLLFDQNLSYKLVRLPADVYPDSVHVRDAGLLHGHPPETAWLRVGNAPTSTIAALLREHRATMRRFHADPDAALLALA